MTYKRTKSDSPLKCPWCGKQFTMNGRYLDYYHAIGEGRFPSTTCKGCGNRILYRNLTAQYVRETGAVATWRKENNYERSLHVHT